MNTSIEKLYSKINNKNDYIIFGLSTCGYCKETKNILKKKNINYKYYPIDEFKELFFKILAKLATSYPELNIDIKHTTVPVIFHKKKFIGGYTDLINLI